MPVSTSLTLLSLSKKRFVMPVSSSMVFGILFPPIQMNPIIILYQPQKSLCFYFYAFIFRTFDFNTSIVFDFIGIVNLWKFWIKF